MRIDRSHRGWIVFSVVVLVASAVIYWNYVANGAGRLTGPRGSSVEGLTFGVVGSLFMLFAGLIGARKRFRTWRIGRAEFWMRGHLWLGTLALPLMWFHGGFAHGGKLTTALMVLLYAIVVSGFVGAILQHYLPKQITRFVKHETVYEQIPTVLRHLRAEADAVAAVCGPMEEEESGDEWRRRRLAALRVRQERGLISADRREQLSAALAVAPIAGASPLREFYRSQVLPFVRGEGLNGLTDPLRCESAFAQRKLLLPPNLHSPLDELKLIVEEVRELNYQRRMHRWLHLWVLVHAPLSMALLVLGLVHAVMALRW